MKTKTPRWRSGFIAVLLWSIVLPLAAQEAVRVEVPLIPADVEEFVALRNEIAVTPEGGAAMFVVAMSAYAKDPDLGMRLFTAILVNDGSMLRDDPAGYGGKAPGNSASYLIRRLDDAPWVASSYWIGTSPENGYTVPEGNPLTTAVSRNPYSVVSETEMRVFVHCTGADSPRPIRLERNNRGVWKVAEFSSLVVGVRPPVEIVDDAL